MADRFTPPDSTQFQALTAGDEPALAAVYRANYDALVAQARDTLGADLAHFGSRVAQQAMLDVWAKRTVLADPQAFIDALKDAVRTVSDLQRRKHAALHHGSHAPSRPAPARDQEPDAAAAVEKLLSDLHAPASNHAQALTEAAEARKHAAAAHVQTVGKSKGLVKTLVIVAVLGAIIVAGMRWLGDSSADVAATKALAAENARGLGAMKGQRGAVRLSDGSQTKIGSDTHIKLPADFGGLVRTLQLKGAASFTVAPNGKLPFEVRAKNAIISATGTTFTVRAYDDDPNVIVVVDEGSVSVRAKDQSAPSDVAAGKAVRVNSDGTVQPADEGQKAMANSWLSDSLVFIETPARVVLSELVRWFDLKALLGDSALGARPVSMRIGLKSSGDALKAMASAANFTVGFDKKQNVVLTDAPPAPAKKGTKKR